ncbi:uncharacterized protein involved in outer membrane biogenesis [Humitalea rosea]|uniref:Uncharacterized protein involved in outer membrane biogenesis n=1 Tax=Humitalea rosea TaxID=990373 RepID=A0A2W7HY65_9PROT|nr:AsmA-like C-terminal region-containing protein [Humitalea rosea]PZW38998.1 uncharacterized protein involved in outer membrane biogenesis [Humitalea rosea]
MALPSRPSRWPRRALLSLGCVLLLLAGLGLAGFFFLRRIDLGPIVAGRVAAALGRPVAIGGLHVTPGRWLLVELAGLRIGNLPGGSREEMLALGRLSLEVEALSLLRGPVVVRKARAEEASLLLERLPDRTANWHFSRRRAVPEGAGDRSWVPTLLDVELHRGEVLVRTTGGLLLRTRLETATLATPAADQPVRLRATGAYNDTAVTLEAALDPIVVLRDASRPYGTDLRFVAGEDTALTFEGSMTAPFDVDGAEGRLSLTAPRLGTLLALAGVVAEIPARLDLAGPMTRKGDRWRLSEASGSFAGQALTLRLLQLDEGRDGSPDAIALALSLEKLALDPLLPAPGSVGGGDTPLVVSQRPDPRLDVQIAIGALNVAGEDLGVVELTATQEPGRINVQHLAATLSGIRLAGSGAVAATDTGARLSAEAALERSDLDDVRKLLGLRSLPMSGRLEGKLALTAEAATLRAVGEAAQVQAVLTMTGGQIAKAAIEMASTDVRALFRDAGGSTPIACMLAVAEMHGGRGTVAPLRLRAEAGTIAGRAQFDLGTRQMDLVIGSQSETTGFFALDVPVRVSGAFASPSILPAEWSAEGRAQLAAGDDMAPLPPELRRHAQSNPCFRAGPPG